MSKGAFNPFLLNSHPKPFSHLNLNQAAYHYLPYLLDQQHQQQYQQNPYSKLASPAGSGSTHSALDLLTVASQLNKNFGHFAHQVAAKASTNPKQLNEKHSKEDSSSSNRHAATPSPSSTSSTETSNNQQPGRLLSSANSMMTPTQANDTVSDSSSLESSPEKSSD